MVIMDCTRKHSGVKMGVDIECTYDEETKSTWTPVTPASPLKTISRLHESRQRNILLSLASLITLSTFILYICVRRQGFHLWHDWALAAACQDTNDAHCPGCLLSTQSNASKYSSVFLQPEWIFQYDRDGRNEGLDRDQCRAAFPALFEEITRATSFWRSRAGMNSTKERLDTVNLKDGMGRALIFDGGLYVVSTRADGDYQRRRVLTALGSIHRALVASPHRPSQANIEFVFSVEDHTDNDPLGFQFPVWTLSRIPSAEGVWLMPGLDTGGEYNQAVKSLELTERLWFDKEGMLALRGNSDSASMVQNASIAAVEGDSSNRLQGVKWYDETDVISMDNFCNSKYVAHVEGTNIYTHDSLLGYLIPCR